MGATLSLTEPVTLDGVADFFRTSQPIRFKPTTFTVNGTPTTIRQLNVEPNDGVSWYWQEQGTEVFTQAVTPPPFGTAILITYEPVSSNLTGASVPASISELSSINDPVAPGPYADPNPPSTAYDYTPAGNSGIYTSVYDSLGVGTASEAAALAAGIQRRTSVEPRAISFKTDYPGWKIGQTITANHVALDLIGKAFIVASISAKPSEVTRGRGSYFEYAIEAVVLEDAPVQSPADPNPAPRAITSIYPLSTTAPYEKLNTLTKSQPPAPLYKEWQVILGSGGSLTAADPLGNRVFVLLSQIFIEVYILPDPANPPMNQDLEVDVMLDGDSIFGPAKLIVPAGGTAPTSTTFRGYPAIFRASRGQIMTFSAAYTNITGTPVKAKNVTVQFLGRIN